MEDRDLVCPGCGCTQLEGVTENRFRCESCGATNSFDSSGELQIIEEICPSCGFLNEEQSRFCGKCGTPFFRECPDCGGAVRWFNSFCPDCGADYAKRMVHHEKIRLEKAAAEKARIIEREEAQEQADVISTGEEDIRQKMERWAQTRRKFAKRIIVLMVPAFLLLVSAFAFYMQAYLPLFLLPFIKWALLVSLALFLPCTVHAIVKARRLLLGDRILKNKYRSFRLSRKE
jgi:ribosomal protein S27AE